MSGDLRKILYPFLNCKTWKSEQYVLFALKFAVDHTAQNFYWTKTRWGITFWNLSGERIDVSLEWWKSTKISKKGPKRVAKAYVGRPISAHHDTPWALSAAVDVTGFMVIDSAHSIYGIIVHSILLLIIVYGIYYSSISISILR